MANSRNLLRWAARLTAWTVALAYLTLLGGDLISPHSFPPTGWREWTGIASLSAACLAPALGWRRELAAGLISIAAAGAFAILVMPVPALWIVIVPGVLLVSLSILRPRKDQSLRRVH
jgi:hypothetical protein